MPMKCVVCGQQTDAEAALVLAVALIMRLADQQAMPDDSYEAGLEYIRGVLGRGSSTDRAPGRNPGDAGSSPAPSTPDEDKHG